MGGRGLAVAVCIGHSLLLGTWLASLPSEEKELCTGFHQQGFQSWLGQKSPQEGAESREVLSQSSRWGLETITCQSESKDGHDMALFGLQDAEQSPDIEVQNLWRTLDPGLGETQEIQQIQQQTQEASSTTSTFEVRAAQGGGQDGLDGWMVSGESPVDTNNTTSPFASSNRRTNSEWSRGKRTHGECAATATTAQFAASTADQSCWGKGRGSYDRRGDESISPSARFDGIRCGTAGVPSAEKDAARGEKQSCSVQKAVGTQPYQQVGQGPRQGQQRSWKTREAGQGMGILCAEDDFQDQPPQCDVPTSPGRAYASLQHQVGGAAGRQERGGNGIQEAIGSQRGGTRFEDIGRTARTAGACSECHAGRDECAHSHSGRGRPISGRNRSDGQRRRDGAETRSGAAQSNTADILQGSHFSNKGGYTALEGQEGEGDQRQQGEQGQIYAVNRQVGVSQPSRPEPCTDPLNKHMNNAEGLHFMCRRLSPLSSLPIGPCKLKQVSFSEELSFHAWNEKGEQMERIVQLDLFPAWSRSLWHLHGQVCKWENYSAVLDAPHLHAMSLFQVTDGELDSADSEHPGETSEAVQNQEQESLNSNQVQDGSATQAWNFVISRSQDVQQRRKVVEVWYVREDHFPVCIQPRRVERQDLTMVEDFERRLRGAWFDLIQDGVVTFWYVQPQPRTFPSTIAHVIMVENQQVNDISLMMKSELFPVLQKLRVALVKFGDSTRQIFQHFQVRRACTRPDTMCALMSDDQVVWESEDIPILRQAQVVQGYMNEADQEEEESSQEDASSESVGSTQVPDDSDTDETSLGVFSPGLQFRTFDHQEYPWEQDVDDLLHQPQVEESDEESHDFAPNIARIQALVSAAVSQTDQSLLVVTFGVGLVHLGRRECEIPIEAIQGADDVVERVIRLWQDHAQVADPVVHPVVDQPDLDIGRPYITLLVAFDYQEGMDPPCPVLVRQTCRDDESRCRSFFAARLPMRASDAGILQTLDLDQGIFPEGLRESSIVLRGERLVPAQPHDVLEGSFCDIWISSFPQHAIITATWLANAEQFLLDQRILDQNGVLDTIHCRFHAISPQNRPLGSRDLYLPRFRLFLSDWRTEAEQLWPFAMSHRTKIAYATADLHTHWQGENQVPVFHFVVSYCDEPSFVPVLIRQSVVAVEQQTVHTETWAVALPQWLEFENLKVTLDPSVFWIHENFRPRIRRAENHGSAMWKPGESNC